MELFLLFIVFIVCIILTAFIASPFVIIIIFFYKKLKRSNLRKSFEEAYHVTLPHDSKLYKVKQPWPTNAFALRYPHWASARANGLADRRCRNNRIIWDPCILCIGTYQVDIDNPLVMLRVVRDLRQNGASISLCKEEKEKLKLKHTKEKTINAVKGVEIILEAFENTPTQFEHFCAIIFESLGYTATVTPCVKDNGYDIVLKKDGKTGIAECKCYALTNKVGRPAIQKVVGANQTVGGDFIYFVTTSTFTAAAKEYAEQTGVTLVNGTKLMELVEQANQNETNHTEKDEQVELTKEDLRPHVPADMYQYL